MKPSAFLPTRLRLTWFVTHILAALLASGCMRTNIEMLTPVEYAPVDPDTVQVFVTAEAPSSPARITVVSAVQQGSTPRDKEELTQHSKLVKPVAVTPPWAPTPVSTSSGQTTARGETSSQATASRPALRQRPRLPDRIRANRVRCGRCFGCRSCGVDRGG